MKTIKLTDLNGKTAYINHSALVQLAQIALGKSYNDIKCTLREHSDAMRNGKGIMPCNIDRLTYQVQSLQTANEVLHCLQESAMPNKQRQLIIVRDDIAVPIGYERVGQYDKMHHGDLQWCEPEMEFIDIGTKPIGQMVLDAIVIRKVKQ